MVSNCASVPCFLAIERVWGGILGGGNGARHQHGRVEFAGMQRPRWSLRRARVLVGTKFLLIAGLVGFVVVAWLVELVAGLHDPVNLGPLLAGADGRASRRCCGSASST